MEPTMRIPTGADSTPTWVDRAAYPFAGHWLDLPGEGRIHFLDEGPTGGGPAGEGSTIVFVHGTPSWSFDWRHLVAGLRATHRCLAPDHLGFGLSERPEGADYAPEAHARRFRAWMDALQLRDVTLVVHDFGGPIGLPVALDGDRRVARIVVLNSWMWSFQGDRGMERKARLAGGPVGRWMYRRLNASLRILTPSAYGDRKKLTPAVHGQLLAPFPDPDARERVLWALARALLGSSDFYDGLWRRRGALAALPALIVWGRRDPAFPPHCLQRWRDALPHARVVEVDAGHWPQEEKPEETLDAVRAFLHTAAADGPADPRHGGG